MKERILLEKIVDKNLKYRLITDYGLYDTKTLHTLGSKRYFTGIRITFYNGVIWDSISQKFNRWDIFIKWCETIHNHPDWDVESDIAKITEYISNLEKIDEEELTSDIVIVNNDIIKGEIENPGLYGIVQDYDLDRNYWKQGRW